MSLLALTNQLRPCDLPLESLYLDPNNPRFVDSNWSMVSDDQIAESDIQEQTRRKLVQDFNVNKLRMNMEVNGFLPIDRIIVREFLEGKFVVLEGNRRICSAKMITRIAMDGSEVSTEVLNSLGVIPALQYTGGDTNAAWIFQGLRHITGIEGWSAFNKAKLLVEQMEDDQLSLSDVGRRFGLSSFGAGQWVRGYYAFKQAREESDFISEVDERSYPYFQELFSRSSAAVREWIEWNDSQRKFSNLINYNEFVSWLYPRVDEEDTDSQVPRRGNWEKRWLARRDDIRDVAFLIREDPEMFQQFRNTGKLEFAYSQALAKQYEQKAREKADPIKDVFDSIRACIKALENLPLKVIRDPGLKSQLDALIVELEQKVTFVK